MAAAAAAAAAKRRHPGDDGAGEERPASPDGAMASAAKKARAEPVAATALVVAPQEEKKALVAVSGAKAGGVQRSSDLAAPTMLLSGHGAEVTSCRFAPDGRLLASSSFDKLILLWEASGACRNVRALKGHRAAVLEAQWNWESKLVLSASADATAAVFDAEDGAKVRGFKGHEDVVNSISVCARGDGLVATASNDKTALLWDPRARDPVHAIVLDAAGTAVACCDEQQQVFVGSLDNDILCIELRTGRELRRLSGHADSVTGLSASSDGAFLLSIAMDHTVRQWDIRPYVRDEAARMMRVFLGSMHDLQKNLLRCAWSPDCARVAAGSADGMLNVWDVATQAVLYKLPGHAGAVLDASFHPSQPVIASCGADRKIFLGELLR